MKEVTFSKWIMKIVLIQGLMMMWCSYGLALIGRTQIAEGLSKVVCAEVVGVAIGYFAKAGVENLSKHNENWPATRGDGL